MLAQHAIIHAPMNTGLDGSSERTNLDSGQPASFQQTSPPWQARVKFLWAIEPIWVGAATAVIYSSYLFQLPTALTWAALVLASTPLLARIVAKRTVIKRTEFDVGLVLLIVGGIVGLAVSPMFHMSLGAIACMLGISLFYYSATSYPDIRGLVRLLLPFSAATAFIWFLVVVVTLGHPPDPEGTDASTYHGLALSLLIVGSIFLGMALAKQQATTASRVVVAAACILLFGAIIYLVYESFPRMLSWDSVQGRLPRWEQTIELLRDHPITGLGLGGWGYAYHGGEILTHPTHAHNAYLELYANTGLFGALALVIALVVGARLAWRIIRSPRNHPWYGFGVGVVIACVATLLVGVVESAPIGVPLVAEDTYYYLISPVPWILAGLLVAAKDLLGKEMKE